MLYLLLTIANKRYALPTKNIVEVLPNLVSLQSSQDCPPADKREIINYYGEFIPVIDICHIHTGIPCRQLFSSRIIIIDLPIHHQNVTRVGILAEQVTETVRIDSEIKSIKEQPNQFAILLKSNDEDSGKMIEIFDIKKMLPANLNIF